MDRNSGLTATLSFNAGVHFNSAMREISEWSIGVRDQHHICHYWIRLWDLPFSCFKKSKPEIKQIADVDMVAMIVFLSIINKCWFLTNTFSTYYSDLRLLFVSRSQKQRLTKFTSHSKQTLRMKWCSEIRLIDWNVIKKTKYSWYMILMLGVGKIFSGYPRINLSGDWFVTNILRLLYTLLPTIVYLLRRIQPTKFDGITTVVNKTALSWWEKKHRTKNDQITEARDRETKHARKMIRP